MMAPMSYRMSAIATLSLCLVLGLARAQDAEPYEPDPPDRAARLSYIDGDVSMQPAGEEDWAPALLNRPLTTGDKLWTDRDARAEIYVGPAAVRLGAGTGFSFLNVDDDTIQMRMTAGVITLSVRALKGSDHIEIDTPNVALTLLRPGNYRIEVNDAGDATTVKVSDGEMEATGPSQNVIVHAQQVATFRGLDELTAQWGTLGAPDEFDRWTLDRERRDERAASSRTAEYVSPDVTGYEDLDDYGTWSSEPEYGYVWTPRRVALGWSPYQYGRWVWVSPWGWTWIDDAPWGYAPFHYGRWAHVRQRWCWVPGPRHVRAVYAPALVAWVGSGVSVSWFPLGPREVYLPHRRFSRHYVERVNVTNTVIVNRTYINEVYRHRGSNVDYRNRRVPGALTAVSRTTFASGGRVGDHRVRGDHRDFTRDRVTAGPEVNPGRESRLGGAPNANRRGPPRNVVDRQVIVQRDPPASGARFARSPRGNADRWQTSNEGFTRPQDRVARDRDGSGDAVVRDRPDRPQRNDRPAMGTAPSAQPSVPDQRGWVDRPRDDRPLRQRDLPHQREQPLDRERPERERQDREREQQSRDQQQYRQAEVPQRWQRRDDQDRQQRDQQQRRDTGVQQGWQRPNDQERQQRPQPTRQVEQHPRPEQRERSVAQPRVERPREDRSNNRSAPPQKPAESKPPKQRDDQPRPSRY
jgi:hypothetical protein